MKKITGGGYYFNVNKKGDIRESFIAFETKLNRYKWRLTMKKRNIKTSKKIKSYISKPTIKYGEEIELCKFLKNDKVNELIGSYAVCEKIALKIIKSCYLDEFISNTLNIAQLKFSINKIGYKNCDNEIDLIFNTGNNKSLRKLRNLVMHDASKKAMMTLENDFDMYAIAIKKFIENVSNKK